MKKHIFSILTGCLALFTLSCDTDTSEFEDFTQVLTHAKSGAVQISGTGYFADATDCDIAGQSADFALLLTGDLEGCLYTFVDYFDCSPSGTYREEGRELFVGTYNGQPGTFRTTYKFHGKFEGCADDGFYLGAEIFGKCQHPIETGSGDGVFAGVKGRIDFTDNVVTGELPYTGHLKY